MKKILMYVNSMNTFGGRERVVANLSDKFSEYYEVTILVKNKPISAYRLNEKVTIETLDTALIMNMRSRLRRIISVFINIFKSIRALNKYFATHSYDYLYTALPTNCLEVYFANKNYRNKIIASEHASYYAYNNVYKKIKEWLYPKLNIISVPTIMDTKIYQSLGYNAVYIPHITTQNLTYSNMLNSKRIINVGRLTKDKQQDVLLEIWELFNRKLPNHDWKLQIIGSGEEENNLKRKINSLKLFNVEIIPHTSRINDYYQNAELFVFTSRMEGFGMVLLEAMSYGVPCISFDCPSGPRDIIKNGKNGYLIECYNKESFVDKMYEYVTATEENRKIYSNEAITTVKNWDNDKIIHKWIKAFESLK